MTQLNDNLKNMKRNLLIVPVGISLCLVNFGCRTLTSPDSGTSTTPTPSNYTVSNSQPANSPTGKTKISYASGPLLGKWEEMDSPSHTMEFKEDGSLVIEYAGRTIHDKYEYMSGDQIADTDSKGKTRYPNFTVKGDEMTLTWSDAVV